jgi:hypothetical protein
MPKRRREQAESILEPSINVTKRKAPKPKKKSSGDELHVELAKRLADLEEQLKQAKMEKEKPKKQRKPREKKKVEPQPKEEEWATYTNRDGVEVKLVRMQRLHRLSNDEHQARLAEAVKLLAANKIKPTTKNIKKLGIGLHKNTHNSLNPHSTTLTMLGAGTYQRHRKAVKEFIAGAVGQTEKDIMLERKARKEEIDRIHNDSGPSSSDEESSDQDMTPPSVPLLRSDPQPTWVANALLNNAAATADDVSEGPEHGLLFQADVWPYHAQLPPSPTLYCDPIPAGELSPLALEDEFYEPRCPDAPKRPFRPLKPQETEDFPELPPVLYRTDSYAPSFPPPLGRTLTSADFLPLKPLAPLPPLPQALVQGQHPNAPLE